MLCKMLLVTINDGFIRHLMHIFIVRYLLHCEPPFVGLADSSTLVLRQVSVILLCE
jgi:hypothetical protein